MFMSITSATDRPKHVGWYAAWSVLSLLSLFLLSHFWHSPKQARGYFDIGAVFLVIAISIVCIWAFLRCPFRHWVVKAVTTLSLLVALFYLGLTVWIYFFHQ